MTDPRILLSVATALEAYANAQAQILGHLAQEIRAACAGATAPDPAPQPPQSAPQQNVVAFPQQQTPAPQQQAVEPSFSPALAAAEAVKPIFAAYKAECMRLLQLYGGPPSSADSPAGIIAKRWGVTSLLTGTKPEQYNAVLRELAIAYGLPEQYKAWAAQNPDASTSQLPDAYYEPWASSVAPEFRANKVV